ncbi:MAG: BMP family ABC transporter substrate-binding protein [Oscillospiraceae bacterium]|nr:BMP family ABC transporter substrate-binding protein [Oscillospiraceae bacterium]
MKRIFALLLAACVMLAMFAGCGSTAESAPAEAASAASAPEASAAEASTPEAPAASGDYKVAMITDYGDITDQSFNQTTYEACKEYCEGKGVDFSYYKPAGDSTAERVAMVEAAINDGYNVIVMPGFAFGETIVETAPNYPDITFIALDVSQGDLGDFELPSNVFCAVYQEELAGYMAGYAAVKLGYTKLGFLGGMAVPAVIRYGYGFVQGANAAAVELGNTGDVSVQYVYGNQFYGDADITAYMDTWYQTNGVEVVFACGGGIYTSAAEAAAKVEGAKVIGVDVDQAAIIDGAYGEGMTVTSAMKGLAATVKSTLAELIENNNWAAYGGTVTTLGLVSDTDMEANYVQIPMATTQWSDSFTQDDYTKLVADMYSGAVTVSSDTEAMPAVEIKVDEQGNIK